MNIRILVMLGLATFSAFAEEYISPVTGKPIPMDGKYTLEQYKARDERVMRKTGGFITQAAEGPIALFVDTRAKPTLTIDEVARLYRLGTHLDCAILKEKRDGMRPLEFAQAKMLEKSPLLVVVVIEDINDLPALSVFPEERIGIVNADKLMGGSDRVICETRVAKEIWRAIGFVGGLGFSPQDNDVMQPYYSLDELDANTHPYIQPMNMARMQGLWKRFGVKKARRIPYSVAVQEGWAAAPTNEYQKAIWEKVHAIPSEPMKIEFDPKRGK